MAIEKTHKKKVLTQAELGQAVNALADKIMETPARERKNWAVVGIQRRGVPLSRRLVAKLNELGVKEVPTGTLDITLYRDDMNEGSPQPIVHDTHIPFDINGKTIFLVDDVLYTGRTIRCALDEIMDFGRPTRVYLAVLVDRGHRELPIAADFVGRTLVTSPIQRVEVHLEEIDGEDAVWLAQKKDASLLKSGGK
jgi:pyrimidine operon attenuation protein/uracil phosphoribosyltransferase